MSVEDATEELVHRRRVPEGCCLLGERVSLFIYLFGVLHRFQHCTGHITAGSSEGRGNQYIEFVRVLYCKLLSNSKQLPAFPLETVPGTKPRSQRWEARVLPFCHRGRVKELETCLCELGEIYSPERRPEGSYSFGLLCLVFEVYGWIIFIV